MSGEPKKLVLTVIDAMKPAMLDRAIQTGRAPALKLLIERGAYVDDCVAAYPSVTPVCAASIATGVGPDEHEIPSMNWYHRGEGRYVEYGTSFKASQTFGFKRSLTDTIYNMNLEHLSSKLRTVFETLDDADIRTAGTTYLMYRGRHRHEVTSETALTRLASTVFRHAVYGPREFFYADIFASRKTGCRAQLGLPGQRDQHAGCVGAELVENDLFDFLLLSLPDNDTHSHRNGPFAQVSSIAAADKQIERLMHAGGGPDEFLEDHAMIVLSDHSQSQVEREIDLFKAFDGFGLEPPAPPRVRRDGEPPEIAVCPSSRSAQVYVLDRERRAELVPRIERTALALEGVDLVMHLTDHPDGEAAIRGRRGELRFMPGGTLTRPARRALERRGRPRPAQPQRPRRRSWSPPPTRTRSAACGRRCAAAPPPRSCSRPARATSSSTGAAITTSAAARTGRCTPTTRWARCCGAAPARTARTRAPSGRCATSCRWCASTSACPPREGGAPRARDPAGARAGRGRPGPHLARALRRAAAGLGAGARRRDGRPSPRGRRCAAPAAATRCTYGRVYYKSKAKRRWQVSFFAPPEQRRRAHADSSRETVVDDRSGRVLESWTGYKVEWTMARGYAGAFGGVANALWVWLPLCALFVLPFARPPLAAAAPRPRGAAGVLGLLRVLQRRREIGVSVPLVYPLLGYLLARMLGIAFSRARGREPPPLRLTVPVGALGIAAVFVLGFRTGLNVIGSNVIDVGYASVIGADRFGRRRGGLRPLPARQPARRHLRPGPLLRVRPVRGAAAVERDAGTTCPPPTPRRSPSTC